VTHSTQRWLVGSHTLPIAQSSDDVQGMNGAQCEPEHSLFVGQSSVVAHSTHSRESG
jgi:hypothetical protein